MNLKRVFPDTGVLLAMIVFPRDRSGSTTLAGEVLELVTTQAVIASLPWRGAPSVGGRNLCPARLRVQYV
ncbi:MAG: hypothetical protein WBW48_11940 [Anaerolineae bacterium]